MKLSQWQQLNQQTDVSLSCLTLFICGGPCHLSSFKRSSGTLFSSESSSFIRSDSEFEFLLQTTESPSRSFTHFHSYQSNIYQVFFNWRRVGNSSSSVSSPSELWASCDCLVSVHKLCRCSACFTVSKHSSKCSRWYLLEVWSGFFRVCYFLQWGESSWWNYRGGLCVMNSSHRDEFGEHTTFTTDGRAWLYSRVAAALFSWLSNLSVTDCVILSDLPAGSKSQLLFSLFRLRYFTNFMNPIHQTFKDSASACPLHNSAAAIKAAPHPEHVTTSRWCVAPVTDDSSRWKREAPAGSSEG